MAESVTHAKVWSGRKKARVLTLPARGLTQVLARSWGSTWQHFDNLDHVRPTTGVATWDAPSKWNLPGREFPGPCAE